MPMSVTTSPSRAAAFRCLGNPAASWMEKPCSAGQRSKIASTRTARSCSSAAVLMSGHVASYGPAPADPARTRLVQRADENLAAQQAQRLRTLVDHLGDGACDVGVDLVVLLAAAPRVEGDLGDEQLALEALAVNVVGQPGAV